nr:subtilisin-like protease SBT4.3 [Tanacetum cinerariifolium]
MLTKLESQSEYDCGSGSDGCGDDEPGDDDDGAEDGEDEDDRVAKGGVPSARLAVYKVCEEHCHTTDILSAFVDAIADGVDVLSVSVVFNDAINVAKDPIAIGSFMR